MIKKIIYIVNINECLSFKRKFFFYKKRFLLILIVLILTIFHMYRS